MVGVEINLVNLFSSQPHHENLPTGEGPYRGIIVTTADGGSACGIGIDVGDGSNRPVGESGWWTGMRLRMGRAYRDWETDRKSTRLNSSHLKLSRMPSSA